MATIKDVASLAGVSVATVSRVLNSPECVSEANKKLVEEAIEKLNYIPNFLGRNLRQQSTKRIIVVLNSISNQFYSRVLKGIEDRAKQDDYTVLVCATRDNRETILKHLEMLSTKVADGAIFMSPELATEEILHLSSSYSIVCTCEPIKSRRVTSVTIDDIKASFDATNFLIEKGKRDIVLISAGSFSYSSDLREEGFKKALHANKIKFDESMILREGYTYNAGVRAAKRLLAREKLPQAAFTLSDSTAIGAIKTFNDNGVSIPDDLSVMGFDNTALSEMFIPSITTVAQPQHEMGVCAMDLLIKKINGKKKVHKKIVGHEIIHRQSVK